MHNATEFLGDATQRAAYAVQPLVLRCSIAARTINVGDEVDAVDNDSQVPRCRDR